MIDLNYRRGLHTLTTRSHAWMLPNGNWGWSNAGLIVGKGESLLFDTLFDLPLTQEMLDGIAEVTRDAPLRYAVNSHANGDHFHGNQLLGPDVEIIATEATNRDMLRDPHAAGLRARMKLDTPVGDFVRTVFKPFDFEGISVRGADRTFERQLTLDIGGVEVQLHDLGPAHTASDVVAYVPSEGVVYAADLLFIGGTPIAWAGPITGWVAALDQLLEWDAPVVVPGHGPVTDASGIRDVKTYLELVIEKATELFEQGVPVVDAARTIDMGRFGILHEHGRIVQNVLNVYRDLDPSLDLSQVDVMGEIAALEGF